MKFNLIFASLTVLPLFLYAEENPILQLLSDDMSESARIATSTNQNIDYQPFILSVYNSNDLAKFGVQTLGEALMLVPGVDIATNNMNNRTAIFRGSNPTSYGQSTLVMDGYVLNDLFFNTYNPYFDFPIELIERIEVVRGSGSFIDGVNGYAGTINVITKASASFLSHENGAVFAHTGSNSASGLGGWGRYGGENYKLSIDVFRQSHDQKTPITVLDQLGQRDTASLGSQYQGLGIHYKYGSFELQGRYNDYRNDAAFGTLFLLPNEEGYYKQPSWYAQGKYTFNLSNNLNVALKSSVMENTFRSNSRIAQPGLGYDGPYGPVVFLEGEWADFMLKTRRISGSGSLYYTGVESHKFSLGIESIWDSAIDMYSKSTNLLTGVGLVDYTHTPFAFIHSEDAKRQTTTLYLSDNITVSDTTALALTFGAIRASDIDTDYYGRASLVYQPTRDDIFKLLIGDGIRFPSFQELYLFPTPYATGNTQLSCEYVKSYETQYLHKITSNLTAEINLFYLQNTQQIVRDITGTFQNSGDNVIHGGEAELRGKMSSDDMLSLSYSYIHGKVSDYTNGYKSDLPYAASHLIKAAYSYDFISGWTLGGVWNYVGSKKRYLNDTRNDLSSYNTFDLAIGWQMDEKKGWYAQAILKNIGDTIIRYPSPASTYPDDYPISDRSFWFRTGWRF